VQSASGAIRYSAEPVDGVLGGGIEFIGHGKQAGEEANAAFGDALALGADDAADGSVQNIRLCRSRHLRARKDWLLDKSATRHGLRS
jgi:hypothetical protein